MAHDILLCWPYDRPGYVAPFRSPTHRYTYLYHPTRDAETVCATTDVRRYWDEFTDAAEVLRELRPRAIVFQAIGTPRRIALNLAARAAGIPTYTLQHGLEYDARDSARLMAAAQRHMSARGIEHEASTRIVANAGTGLAIDFLRRSVRGAARLEIPLIVAYSAYLRYTVTSAVVDRTFRFAARFPTARLCHSLHDADVAFDHDGATVPRIVVGNAEYDGWFAAMNRFSSDAPNPDDEGSYYLFIDSPVAAPEIQAAYMTPADAIAIYERASAYAAERGKRLVVKLHPFLPPPRWLPRHLPNVDWVTQADLFPLIRGSVACFSYFSTLTLWAALIKPVCLIKYVEMDIYDELESLGAVTCVSSRGIARGQETLHFGAPARQVDRERFVRRFFWRTDGQAADRLARVLDRGLAAEAPDLPVLRGSDREPVAGR